MAHSPTASAAALEDLYVKHHGWLVAWLRRRLPNLDLAADLAQDTFTRLLAAERNGRDIGMREPRAYLATVANRLVANHLQRQALEQAWLDTLAALPEAMAPSPEQQLVIFQALQEIETMLQGLPPPVRQAFLLSQIDGLSYAEIAERLHVTPRTIKRYMAQAFTQCILLVG